MASHIPEDFSFFAASSKAPTPGRIILSAFLRSSGFAVRYASAPINLKELVREKMYHYRTPLVEVISSLYFSSIATAFAITLARALNMPSAI